MKDIKCKSGATNTDCIVYTKGSYVGFNLDEVEKGAAQSRVDCTTKLQKEVVNTTDIFKSINSKLSTVEKVFLQAYMQRDDKLTRRC